jgi:hypothetical protein
MSSTEDSATAILSPVVGVVVVDDAVVAPPPIEKQAETCDMREVVREMLRLRVQQQRLRTLHTMYQRRTQSLTSRLSILSTSIFPIAAKVRKHRMDLYRMSMIAPTAEARRKAHAELAELVVLARTMSEKQANAALFSFAATYDSDSEINEHPPVATSLVSDGDDGVKRRKKRQMMKVVGAVRGAPNNVPCQKKPARAATAAAAAAPHSTETDEENA